MMCGRQGVMEHAVAALWRFFGQPFLTLVVLVPVFRVTLLGGDLARGRADDALNALEVLGEQRLRLGDVRGAELKPGSRSGAVKAVRGRQHRSRLGRVADQTPDPRAAGQEGRHAALAHATRGPRHLPALYPHAA